MSNQTVIHVQATSLSTFEQLVLVTTDMRKHFHNMKLPAPPLPTNLSDFVHCELLVTETTEADGSRKGRIQFISPEGQVPLEQTWVIAPARP